MEFYLLKPWIWIIIGVLMAAPFYAVDKLMIFNDMIMTNAPNLYMVYAIIGAVLIQGGIIVAIIGTWKWWRQKKAKTDPTFYDEKPVDMTRQTIYALIPVFDLYAAYKIKKFWAVFLILIGVGIGLSFIGDLGLDPSASYLLPISIEMIVTVFLIREWSYRWNKKFESTVVSA